MASPWLQQGAHVPRCLGWAADRQLVAEAEEANAEKVEAEEVETIEKKIKKLNLLKWNL